MRDKYVRHIKVNKDTDPVKETAFLVDTKVGYKVSGFYQVPQYFTSLTDALDFLAKEQYIKVD